MTTSTLSTTTRSVTPSPSATVPPVPGFTAPFPQPASCSPSLTKTITVYSGYGTTISKTLLLPDESSPYYTDCLDPVNGQFSFSPGVCLEGWVAWWMGRTSAETGPSEYTSTAYCFAPGYSMAEQSILPNPSPTCSQDFVSTTTRTNDIVPVRETLSIARLPAWHISWQTTDLPTLSPQPPSLDSGERASMWVPGSDPQYKPVDNWGGGHFNSTAFHVLVILIPLLLLAGIAWWISRCCFPRYPVPKKIRDRSNGKAGQGASGAVRVGAN
ncbi:hypothetical protein V8F33_010709 [Rhypophila sp. PSN 637]